MSARDLHAVVIGDATVALVTDAPLLHATAFAREQRGDAIIAAVQAARLGATTALVARVGDDVFGDWLLETWEREELHLDFAYRGRGRNALTLESRADGPHRALLYRAGGAASALDRDDVAQVPWRRARVAFATGPTLALGPSPRAAVLRAFELAREAGVHTILDPCLRAGAWPEEDDPATTAALHELLPMVDTLVIGAPYATGRLLTRANAAEAAQEARRRGVPRVVVRDSGRAAVLAEGHQVTRVEAPNGGHLGDDAGWATGSFAGALIAGLAAGRPLDAACLQALEAMGRTLAGTGAGFARLPRDLAA